MRLYISGSITAVGDKDKAAAQFKEWQLELEKFANVEVLNPFDVDPCTDFACARQEWVQLWPLRSFPIFTKQDHTWQCWLKYDIIAMLQRCDAVCMLPGWEISEGAQLEKYVAERVGMPVMEYTDWLNH